jgi:uncharacterized protein (TIGR03067 family)
MLRFRSTTAAFFAILFAATASAANPDKPTNPAKIEGRWKVVSVEFAGAAVPGLAGAELVLSDGKKTFTLPEGRVERGTYRLDPDKEPYEIDSTTEGREGSELGIYNLDGDTLTLCLSAAGGERPADFSPQGNDRLRIVLRRDAAQPPDESPDATGDENTGEPGAAATTDPPQDKPTGARPFRMGFTGFVHDTTLQAVTASRKFVRENGDILAHHIEGVPWAEAHADEPFPAALLEEWEGKKSTTPPGGKVYLAISPGRGELKLAEKSGPLPVELAGKPYDDPLVKRAYLNYCRRAIEFFQPDYLAIGIEVNEIHDQGPRTWQAYAALHEYIYAELKKDHAELPIFASWTLHNMFKKRGGMLEAFKELMPHNDLVAVSYYPFFVDDANRLAALDWMLSEFAPFEKPFAMVETNDAAERLPLPQAGVVIEGTPEKQAAYYKRLLDLAQKHDFEFVISFIHQDYDALWERIKAVSPELFIAWRDCGLVDESGVPRPAYTNWKEYFKLPLRPQMDGTSSTGNGTMRLKIELPRTWAQKENPDGPATFTRQGSTNAFQVSWAEYRGGELPTKVTADRLKEMAVDFGQKKRFGDLVESSSGACRYGSFGTAVFSTADYPRIQVWYVSNGRDFIMATHICDRNPDPAEVAEVQQIAQSLALGP